MSDVRVRWDGGVPFYYPISASFPLIIVTFVYSGSNLSDRGYDLFTNRKQDTFGQSDD